MASPPVAPAKVHYPSSDGKPMAESDFQRTPLTYAVDRLRQHFAAAGTCTCRATCCCITRRAIRER